MAKQEKCNMDEKSVLHFSLSLITQNLISSNQRKGDFCYQPNHQQCIPNRISQQKVGGSLDSQHKYGMAADIRIAGVSPKAIATYVNQLMPERGGIGVYSSYIHVDVRNKKTRW